jgi:hypothetical protein
MRSAGACGACGACVGDPRAWDRCGRGTFFVLSDRDAASLYDLHPFGRSPHQRSRLVERHERFRFERAGRVTLVTKDALQPEPLGDADAFIASWKSR